MSLYPFKEGLITKTACWFALAFSCGTVCADVQRPSIWVSKEDRAGVLDKIENQLWAQSVFQKMKDEVDPYVDRHVDDPDWILGRVPLTWGGENYTDFRWAGTNLVASGKAAHPTVHFIKDRIPRSKEGQSVRHPRLEDVPPFNTHPTWGMKLVNRVTEQKVMVDELDAYMRNVHRSILEKAVDAAVLYWMTGEDQYAAFSADILHLYCRALGPMNSGMNELNDWGIISDAHLLEARWFSNLLPIIYDFISPYVESEKIYDPVTKQRIAFDREQAQDVFRKYIRLVLERGIIDCNWVVFESSSLVNNALALDDPNERQQYMNYFLSQDTPSQQSMKTFMSFYTQDAVWFETPSYADSVNVFLAYLFNVVDRHDPDRNVVKNYYPVLFDAIHAWPRYQFPNGDFPLFGDSRRQVAAYPFTFEMMYHLAVRRKMPAEQARIAFVLKGLIRDGQYERSSYEKKRYVYTRPLQLLWFEPMLEGDCVPVELPRTDGLNHAGLVLQRNAENAENGLMVWLGGAHHVHAHANGINMELYGLGEVVGVDAGHGAYASEMQNQYYRLYAAHNTVIVNNASRGKGGWENIGQETVQMVSMEPPPRKKAVSPDCSFATTVFTNWHGQPVQHALQQRTIALIRTTPTTGYYVDVFRSRAEDGEQFHDYLYHNIGDSLQLMGNFDPQPAPDWFGGDIGDVYRQPGTRWFEPVSSSGKTAHSVSAVFNMVLGGKPARTQVWFPAGVEREYAAVWAPPSQYVPQLYRQAKTPTLVVRKSGEAWDEPFVAVYEVFRENPGASVEEALLHPLSNELSMLQVESKTPAGQERQRIFFSDHKHAVYTDGTVSFKGRFAVCSEVDGELDYIYFGDASSIEIMGWRVAFKDGMPGALNISFKEGPPTVVSEREVLVEKTPGP